MSRSGVRLRVISGDDMRKRQLSNVLCALAAAVAAAPFALALFTPAGAAAAIAVTAVLVLALFTAADAAGS